MTVTPDVIALLAAEPKPEPKLDRWKRYLITPADGSEPVAHTRVTTIAEVLDDRHNLEKWMMRMTALGIVARRDLYALIASTPADDRKALDDACDKAKEAAKASAGANTGTALHRFSERLDRGEELSVPPPWDADLAAYSKALAEAEIAIVPDYIEQTVVLAGLQEPIAGTLDRLVRVRNELCIGDLKTGADLSYSWNAIAVQLAFYSRAQTIYDLRSGTHTPMPKVNQNVAFVFHLPAGRATCTIYTVDLNAGWEAARVSLWARQWRKHKGFVQQFSIPGLSNNQ